MVRRKNSNPKRENGVKEKYRKRKTNSKKKKICFSKVIKQIKKHIFRQRPDNVRDAVQIALRTVNNLKDKLNMNKPRVLSIPKTGGVLPLIPIFAGLSALGALTGGAAGVAKAVNDARSAKQQLQESQRHNKTMESIAMGRGLYLRPYKTGLGLFFRK